LTFFFLYSYLSGLSLYVLNSKFNTTNVYILKVSFTDSGNRNILRE